MVDFLHDSSLKRTIPDSDFATNVGTRLVAAIVLNPFHLGVGRNIPGLIWFVRWCTVFLHAHTPEARRVSGNDLCWMFSIDNEYDFNIHDAIIACAA
jgi:hypothetical protein